jgi:diguanylate cyclase (GGDEF)-like protein
MSRAILHLVRPFAGTALVLSVALAVVAGLLSPAGPSVGGPVRGLVLTAVLTAVAVALLRRLRFRPPPARAQRALPGLHLAPLLSEIEISLALVLGSYGAIEMSGGLSSPLYPLLYGVIAFVVSFHGRAAALVTVLATLAFELALVARAPSLAGLRIGLLHLVFVAAAAAAHLVFLRGQVLRLRQAHRQALEAEIGRQREAARDYRLIAAALGADSRAPRRREEEESKLLVGAVEAIRALLYHHLRLVKHAVGARTCVLLWLDERTGKLKIKELVSDADELAPDEQFEAAGVLGAVLRDRAVVALPSVRPGQLPYYLDGTAIGGFLGMPVLDGPHLRGILCVDRPAPFAAPDVEVLGAATEQILRAIESEQIFAAVERAKYEHERFYQASALLCRALTVEQVLETAFDAAAQIADYQLAAVTLYDAGRRRHRVSSVRLCEGGSRIVDPGELSQLEFRDNTGITSMVVKTRHPLPASGELRDGAIPVYTKRLRLRHVESLLVMPLLSGDEVLGTFLLASCEKHRFGKDVREMLSIIANQVAVSLQNAMMYRKMETMATTDGLTGLTNHRSFQERFADLLMRCSRHGNRAAILLCDVDHFKRVNDTYGHPVGDEVLRRVAKVLRGAVRKIDIPARYGGEEFAVVLEATDFEGAVRLAERIRQDVAAQTIDSDKGRFQVTMSIGLAVFPEDGVDRAELIERADLALYHAKATGRDRVVGFRQLAVTGATRKAS